MNNLMLGWAGTQEPYPSEKAQADREKILELFAALSEELRKTGLMIHCLFLSVSCFCLAMSAAKLKCWVGEKTSPENCLIRAGAFTGGQKGHKLSRYLSFLFLYFVKNFHIEKPVSAHPFAQERT